jgi:tRNA-specific 2-thiouridylase
MSGGVDSSVAALLLMQQGFDVVGLMLRLWSETGKESSNRCCTPQAMALARRTAGILGIPFHVFDASQAFESAVVQSFLDGYERGATPNPCLNCNRQIRWTFLLERALALGADSMATGHYARVKAEDGGRIRLLRASDATKDQSYVLHVLNQQQLSRAIFPVGELSKAEVRHLAASNGLPAAARHDSQDLCFLAGGDYRAFLRRQRPDIMKPGRVVRIDGEWVGDHEGLAAYTIGQRKGLRLSAATPLYVLRKDVDTNTMVVGTAQELGCRELRAQSVNWISGTAEMREFRAEIKTRYTAKAAGGLVSPEASGNEVRIVFDEMQRDITAGQAAVFYSGNEVVGGGIIR